MRSSCVGGSHAPLGSTRYRPGISQPSGGSNASQVTAVQVAHWPSTQVVVLGRPPSHRSGLVTWSQDSPSTSHASPDSARSHADAPPPAPPEPPPAPPEPPPAPSPPAPPVSPDPDVEPTSL